MHSVRPALPRDWLLSPSLPCNTALRFGNTEFLFRIRSHRDQVALETNWALVGDKVAFDLPRQKQIRVDSAPSCDVVPASPSVLTHHCTLALSDPGIRLKPMTGADTAINDQPLLDSESTILRQGDLGPTCEVHRGTPDSVDLVHGRQPWECRRDCEMRGCTADCGNNCRMGSRAASASMDEHRNMSYGQGNRTVQIQRMDPCALPLCIAWGQQCPGSTRQRQNRRNSGRNNRKTYVPHPLPWPTRDFRDIRQGRQWKKAETPLARVALGEGWALENYQIMRRSLPDLDPALSHHSGVVRAVC